MNKSQKIELKIIAAFFLVSGVFGFFNSFILIFQDQEFLWSLFFVFFAAIFGLTAVAGFLIFNENEKGLEYGRAIIGMQLLNFYIAGYGYYFVTGAYFFLGINDNRLGFDFGLDSTMTISLMGDNPLFILRVNVLAIAIFIYLTNLLNRLDRESELEEIRKTTHNNGEQSCRTS